MLLTQSYVEGLMAPIVKSIASLKDPISNDTKPFFGVEKSRLGFLCTNAGLTADFENRIDEFDISTHVIMSLLKEMKKKKNFHFFEPGNVVIPLHDKALLAKVFMDQFLSDPPSAIEGLAATHNTYISATLYRMMDAGVIKSLKTHYGFIYCLDHKYYKNLSASQIRFRVKGAITNYKKGGINQNIIKTPPMGSALNNLGNELLTKHDQVWMSATVSFFFEEAAKSVVPQTQPIQTNTTTASYLTNLTWS